MGVFAKNLNTSLRFSLSVLKVVGFLTLRESGQNYGLFSLIYSLVWFTFMVGFILIAQTSTMFQIWGDLALMTNASFLLFTNLAFALKIINVLVRKRDIQSIIDESDVELANENRKKGIQIVEGCNRETTRSMYLFMMLSGITVFGWIVSAEKNQLPLRAWYPYDTTKSPAYEITYANQSTALSMSALVNICLDTLVTSLIAVCRCRLRLVALSLRTLCEHIQVPDKHLMTADNEHLVYKRLQLCVMKHEAALKTARLIQKCFTYPVLAQFTVSAVIICVTAYQLAIELNNGKWVRIISMVAYLLCIMLQVFLYCYQGNQLAEESSEIADAVYECPWYACSPRTRRALLIVMVRTRRAVCLTAGGFTTLSLACFTSIIKASYTFFTVLKQVEDRNQK